MSNFSPQSFSPPILNPDVYLNYLPPPKAAQFEVSRDIYLITIGALVCDVLVTLPVDLMIIKSGFRPMLIAYFSSRVSALILVLLSVIAKTKSIAHCGALEFTMTVLWVVAVASTSCLLLRRVYDVFHGRRLVRWIFILMGFITIGVSCLMPIGSHAVPLAQTGYCMDTATRRFIVATAISRLIFDSCVFMGIVYRVLTMEGMSGEGVAWRTILTKNVTTRLTRAFLKGGQQYYLAIIISNILLVSLLTSRSVPQMYKTLFPIPDIAITTSMTCRVYRNLKIKSDKIDKIMSNMLFAESESEPPTNMSEGDIRETEIDTITSSKSYSSPITYQAPIFHAPILQTEVQPPRSIGRSSLRPSELLGGERYTIIKIKPLENVGSTSKSTCRWADAPDSPA